MVARLEQVQGDWNRKQNSRLACSTPTSIPLPQGYHIHTSRCILRWIAIRWLLTEPIRPGSHR
jgi:hypothetical protein